jgi:hydrophobe/amphiphile efflux-1 (HAE1) family protein
MNISEPFIRRPVATSLLAVAILLAGSVAYKLLPVAPLPRVDFPVINVSGALPGASPETIASAVATPLERRFGRIAGVNEITSVSSLGSTQITLQFDLDRNVDAAARDVQAAINAAGGELPPNLPTLPTYRKSNPADAPILIMSARSSTIPLGVVYDQANTVLAQKISQIYGVGQVTVGGGQQPAVRVQADPQALAGANLSLEDVRAALSSTNANEPKGVLTGANQAMTLSDNDQLNAAEPYRNLVISYQNGAAIHLGDIAKVTDSVENNKLAGWADGQRAILIIVRRQPGANILETIDRVKAVLPQLRASLPPSMEVNIMLDRAVTIRASVADIEFTLLLTIALVVAVVFLFLRSARATAIPSAAVPLSIVGTFGVMYLLGYSIDNLSLMALAISTGFVVDDAIVMIENISRYIEAGDEPFEAALKGAKQIGFTIVSITISLVAVFIPILLMGGIIGRLFREFAVTLSISIVVSALVSLTLTPMMCGQFLRHDTGDHGRVYRILERGFDGMLHLYERGLRWVLRHQPLMLLVMLGTLALTVVLYIVVPKGFFPQQDTGSITGISEAAQDISFAAMSEHQQAANAIVQAEPGIAHVNSFIGAANGSAGNGGFLFVALDDKDTPTMVNGVLHPPRKVSADEIINHLRGKLARITGINLYLQAVQDVRMGGRNARTQFQYTLQDANIDELNTWAPKILAKLRTLPQLKDVNSDQQTAGLQASLTIDRDTASRLGVTPQAIDDTLYDAFGQRQVSTIYTELNQYRVILEVPPEYQQNPDALKSIFVNSTLGQQVPLSALTHFQPTTTPLSINHQGQFPATTLSFNLAPGVALGQAVDEINAAETTIGMPPTIHAGFQGTAQAFADSLRSQPFLILAALITVYIVLGILYESLIHPVTILSTLPSAGVGALLALMICHTEFSVIALIGIILLIGIVKKNAIMMIDFALEAERDEKLSPEDAIAKAAILRFRPIMMTTMAALFGGLPLALGSGTGSELRRPLGIAIVGGLLISQVLTLYTTPVMYLYMERWSQAWKKWRRPEAMTPPAEVAAEG